jgi:hypothetical protein
VHRLSSSHKEQTQAADQLLASLEDVRRALHGKSTNVRTLRAELNQLEVSATKLRSAAREATI